MALMKNDRVSDRRSFFLTLTYGLWGLIGSALSLPAAVYLFVVPSTRKKTEWAPAGGLSDLEPKRPKELFFQRNRVNGWKITSEKTSAWVVKTRDQQVIALSPQCTHLGCACRWEEQKQQFLCPCHASAFSVEGRVLSGPAPRPLDRYEVRVEGGKVWIGALRKNEETRA